MTASSFRTRVVLTAFLALAALASPLVLAPDTRADEVQTKDGKTLVGRITSEDSKSVTILTYKDGPVTVDADKVKSTKKKPSLWDDFDKKEKECEDGAEARVKLGEWCKSKGLTYQATKEYEIAIALDRDNEKAHKALGHEKYEGEWKTHDEVMKAKGYELIDGKWVDAKTAEKIHAAHRVAWVLTAAGSGIEADHDFLVAWGQRAKEASKFMWWMSQGQMYVKEITLFRKAEGKPCDYSIENKDSDRIGDGVFAETANGTIRSPGKITGFTFLHELIHLKYGRPHCDNCADCVMAPGGKPRKHPTICDEGDHKAPPAKSCWGAICAFHEAKGITLKPLVRGSEPELPELPETTVIVKD